MKANTKLTKCNFCSYFVGNECTAQKSNGQVNEFYCYVAKQEYFAQLNNKSKKQKGNKYGRN